jgi:uncharacterized membrane protein HdeD (DUF308 family)
MSKRKRASSSKPPEDESGEDSAVNDDMVHVTPDMLAGSPDIFAGKKTEAASEATEPAPPDESADEPVEPTAASTMPSPEPEPEPPAQAPISPTPPPPPFVEATAYPPARPRAGGSSALGIVLVVIGLFALVVVLTGTDLTQYGWPLFIIIPGLTLLVVGFARVGAGATIPGGILSVLGVVLAYCNSTGDWQFLAYGWALVTPGGVGLGIYLQALRDRDQHELRTGRTLLFIGLMIFLIGFVLFESILGISGRDYFGPIGKAALPVLLILVGVILLVRSIQRSRQA